MNNIVLKEKIIKEDKFQNTLNSFKINKNNINNFEIFSNLEENNSFKGKKYANLNKSFVMKIKENLLSKEINPQKSQKILNNPLNKINKNINMIVFKTDEENRGNKKQFSSSLSSEKNKEATKIQKMVNNLRSYIINYNNNLEEMNSKNSNNSFHTCFNNNNKEFFSQRNKNIINLNFYK